jgi:hypothetical protein
VETLTVIDGDAARSLVCEQLAVQRPCWSDDAWLILDEYTLQRDWGWVFFYTSRRWHETGDFRFGVAGNAPYFVRRNDGAMFVAGTAYPVEDYVKDFEREGRLCRRCG